MWNKAKWFFDYYKRYPYVLAVLLFLTPIQSVFQAIVPRMFGFSVDYLQNEQVPDSFLAKLFSDIGSNFGLSPSESFGWSFVFLGLIATILYAFVQSHRAWMNLKLEWMFRQDAFVNTTVKGPDFFNRFRTGDLVTRMTDDVAEKLSWFACSGIFRFYEAVLSVAFIVYMMYTIDPILTLWTAGPLPVLILVYSLFGTSLDKKYDHLQSRISIFNDVIEACFSGVRVVKAYVRELAQKHKFHAAASDRRSAEISAVKITAVVESLWMYLWQFGIVIVLIAGGYMIINSGLTYGNMSVFIYYVVYLIFPMFDIGQFLVKSRQSAVSINRLLELENMPAMVSDNGTVNIGNENNHDLVFENIDYSFPGSDRQILNSVSLTIESGQTVALVGKVGSGKSWLINMIPRLVDPAGGIIKLGGKDLKKFKIEDLRRNVGYVPQEPVLFSDTVKNNILFGRESVEDSVMEWAIEVAQMKSEIESFPKGVNTPIGTRGMAISGGQKQRLALARALAGKPQILILDDCTSALDSKTESELWNRLHEVMPGMTSIIVTHRPDTLQKVDNIFVLEDGKLIDSGTHDELIENDGVYASIYKKLQLEEIVNQ